MSSHSFYSGVPGPVNYKNQECVLYGVVNEVSRANLIQRLSGLCDPGTKTFSEHEMVFVLKVAGDNQVQVRMRRRLNTDAFYWHARYIGAPEPDPSCPTIVRKTIDSCLYSPGMMEFLKAIGLRFDYEFLMDGFLFTKGNIRVTISHISYTEKTGHYERDFRKSLNAGTYLVEVSAMIPDNQDYNPAAKSVREFADQLSPLCDLQKYDYTKE